MAQLEVELVAANGKIWEGSARQVSVRGVEGELGILPGHVPMLTALAEGKIRIDGEGGGKTIEVGGGFLSVDRDRVTIVTDSVKRD